MERLARISARKLFGYLDQDISLATNAGITILHGANGSGKTTILRGIRELSHRIPVTLASVPCEEFALIFESGTRLSMTSPSEEKCKLGLASGAKEKVWEFRKLHPEHLLRRFLRRGPRHREDFELFQFAREMEDTPPHILAEWISSLSVDFTLPTDEAPDWLTEFWKHFHCTLVEEQRLLRLEPFRDRSSPRITRVVTEFSEQLSKLIAEALRQYGEKSQALDRSFPQRVVHTFALPTPSKEDVKTRYAEIDRTRKQLRQASLLEPEADMVPLDDAALSNEQILKVLSLIADDMKEKLSLFTELFRRVSLFKELIDNYFAHKVVQISRKGFHFETDGGDVLNPSSLSSGEQHVLVLFFTLIFRTPQQPHLVLIDEPELSLHPRWQFRLVDDLLRIRDVSQTDFILASHSPQIFEGHWDMARDLNA